MHYIISFIYFTYIGDGWWSFESLEFIGVSKEDGSRCDLVTKCDPYMEVFLNGNNLLFHSEEFGNQVSFTYRAYRSPKIPKKSLVRFEVWDINVYMDRELMFNETRSIGQLIERQLFEGPYLRILGKNNASAISLENSGWQDDFSNL